MVSSRVENTDTTLVISDSKRVDRGEPGGHSFTPGLVGVASFLLLTLLRHN